MLAALVTALLAAVHEDTQKHLTSLGEESMRCSACNLVADKVESSISSDFVREWYDLTRPQRVARLRAQLMSKNCPKIDKMQIAMEGFEPNRKLGDFNELIKKGGTLQNLQTGPEQKEKVGRLCMLVAGHEVDALVSRMEAATAKKKGTRKRRRLVDLKMSEELCSAEGLLRACPVPEREDDDDDDDEDEDDREL